MCGIAGLYVRDGIGDSIGHLVTATNAAQHRGPDGFGFGLYDTRRGAVLSVDLNGLPVRTSETAHADLALGHRRLAIIDLSECGLQPMPNHDRTLWLVYNGEIYNYLELRDELVSAGHEFRTDSDTEVILRAYEEWGDSCVSRFNGMWAFALLDLRRRRLFCSRDRMGVKPLHYFSGNGLFAFASEIKQLLALPFVPRAANERAVYEFLAYAATDYCEETFFAGIHKLLQGHNLIVNLATGNVEILRYYDPPLVIRDSESPADAARHFEELFADSVRLRLRSDVEVGSCLSGGLDSSSIVAVMSGQLARQGRGEMQRTFSSHFDEAEANELSYTEAIIRKTGVRATIIRPTPDEFLTAIRDIVWHQEEPFASTSIFAQWCVYRSAHEGGVKVMLDGQGADEELAGYLGLISTYFRELREKGDWPLLAWEVYRFTGLSATIARVLGRTGRQPPDPLPSWIVPSFEARFRGEERYLQNQLVRPFGEKELLNNTLYQLMFLNNLQALLRYADRSSMAFSVEARLPFLDYRLIEYAFSLPARLKIRGGFTKRVLRDGVGKLLPADIQWRRTKLGFATPERAWQRGVLRSLAETALAAGTLEGMVVPSRAREYADRVTTLPVLDSTPWRWTSVHLWKVAYGLN